MALTAGPGWFDREQLDQPAFNKRPSERRKLVPSLRNVRDVVSESDLTNHLPSRIVFDVTTSMRWTGPPVGIVRVERQLALWALSNLADVKFAFFDPRRMAYCELKTDVRPFLLGDAALETLGLPDPAQPGQRKTDRAPAALRSLVLWIGRFRRMLLGQLEAMRLGTARPHLRRLVNWLQIFVMSKKYREIMVRADGTRRPFLPYRIVLGPPLQLQPSDTLICAGAGWTHTNIRPIRDIKSSIKFRFVVLCHDLIPLLFPHFYSKHDADMFRAYMREALAITDLTVVTSRSVKEDCESYLKQHDIARSKIAVVPLGFDVEERGSHIPPLPDGLSPGRYVLMVSTIEPRKGHRLLYNIWQRLAADGVTQAHEFKLVFVGRRGWMVDDLLQQIRTDRAVSDQIIIMHGVNDDLLKTLYEQAAFCVYPSHYEGYGLPICEAFSHGKAVVVSTGGALPEVAHGLSPCLDPKDEEAWYKLVREWIEHPDARAPFEQAIRHQFRHPTWSEAAELFFSACDFSPPST
jgi:glycosyltransferase involved in cell wall biosynthesis